MLSTSVGTNKRTSVLTRLADVKQYDYSEPTANMSIYILSWAEFKALLSFLSFENIVLRLFLCNKKAENAFLMWEFCIFEGRIVKGLLKHLYRWFFCCFLGFFFGRGFVVFFFSGNIGLYIKEVSSDPMLSHHSIIQIPIFPECKT